MAENLRLERVALAFGGLRVLQEVSFETRSGELLALIGPNGAGKTSVLNCACGIYRASSGRIAFGEVEITHARPHEIAQLGIARTFQHGELFAHLTVVENLLVARHARIPTRLLAEGLFLRSVRDHEAEHRRAVEEVLEFTDLERYRHRQVHELPFGIQKIVGFARALAMQPSVLLLDEPSAGLSRDEREDLARYILRIKHELAIPIVWVEHDMQMVADLADRIYVLDHGEPIAEGPPAEVLSNPRVVSAYLGARSAPAAIST
jgi:branched-chain amino acid transport system ATP-binding protein